MEQLLTKLTIDIQFGSLISKLPPNHYQNKKNTFRNVQRHGINYKLDISDIVDWFIFYGFKESAREKLYGLMNSDITFFDVGANVGDISMHAAKFIGNKGEVHSFEPDPKNFLRLTTNLSLNSFSNVIANNFGFGNKKEEVFLANVAKGNQGMNRIISDNSENIDGFIVKIKTLDSYVDIKNIIHIDLIKIDVEGFEHNVLLGGERVISSYHPTLFIEIDNNNLINQGSSAKSVISFLELKGYNIIHAENNSKITSESDFKECHFDIIAFYTEGHN